MYPDISTVLEVLSNPIRARVILSLGKTEVTKYSDLLQACDLDPYSESGKLGYHLQQLVSLGLVMRDGNRYALTDRGSKASRLMRKVNEIGEEIFASTEQETALGDEIRVREAAYSDIGGILDLWRASLPADEQPDYFVAELMAGEEGIRKGAILGRGSGLGRLVFVAEFEERIIGCLIVDLISLAQMKAFYLAGLTRNELPVGLRLPTTRKEKEFYNRYWEAQSRLINSGSSTGHIETRYGVTGIWRMDGEPIKLIFTRKNSDGEFVTSDLGEIFDEILSCKKIEEDALEARRRDMEDLDYGGPPACMEIFYLVLHPTFDGREVGDRLLGYLEKRAAERGIPYLVTDEGSDDQVKGTLLRDRGFIEVRQPKFEYKHAGKMETRWQLKVLEDRGSSVNDNR